MAIALTASFRIHRLTRAGCRWPHNMILSAALPGSTSRYCLCIRSHTPAAQSTAQRTKIQLYLRRMCWIVNVNLPACATVLILASTLVTSRANSTPETLASKCLTREKWREKSSRVWFVVMSRAPSTLHRPPVQRNPHTVTKGAISARSRPRTRPNALPG